MIANLLFSSLLAATVSAVCDRTFLSDAAGSYLSAQTKGLPSEIEILSTNATYTEQFKPKALNSSILTVPLNITSARSFHDTVLCTSFTQIIVLDPKHPYVIGTRMEGDGLNITKIETLVTDEGDWLFNATGYAYYDGQEDWGAIPQSQRDPRDVIKAAGDAYFDRFADANVTVPWGTPCARLEGGAFTGSGNLSANTCNLGLPSTIKVVDRRYVVDEEFGVVNIYVGFPGLDRASNEPGPDSHLFRVVNGRLRYIHTISTCEGHPGCGLNGTFPGTNMTIPVLRKVRRSWNETSTLFKQ
ncbi:hypothetical protein K458DRAFT_450090 [Lentithecium fluviatile CBS 122367]|uniref:DUF8021 domain-containing protein n=1 Tax=Lentithecium fluviatile CBS 122367 TaxID=1168545 RepID=A0A6G1J3W2_9PLEO|nr:hypothetical protein K458DRAFT_450090 [Lentithecium fluviatile CBS 122367]